ncbi:MAG: hypothetical protein AAF658_03140, partial [Myxococcota bacterium]
QSSEARLSVELRLADVAHNDLADSEIAYAIHRRIFDRDASVESSRDYVFAILTEREQWPELIADLERAAMAQDDPKPLLSHAAHIAESQLGDDAKWIELASAALDLDPEDQMLATQLADRHIKVGNWQQARFLVERQRILSEHEHDFLLRIIEGLRELDRADEVESLRATLADRHPESAEAGLYRLERARAQGDARAIMVESESRLGKVKDLAADEWLALHAEAGDASLEVAEPQNALTHYLATLDTPDPSPLSVLKAAELSVELENDDRLDYVLQIAEKMREQITTEAIKAKDEASERVRWFTLLGQAHEKAEDEPAAIHAFNQAYELSDGVAMQPFDALKRLYERKGNWNALVELEGDRLKRVLDPSEQARGHLRLADIYLQKLSDEEEGEKSLSLALELDPELDEAKQRLGLLMMQRHQFEQGVELLDGQIDIESPDTDLDILLGYFAGLTGLGRNAQAIDVGAVILDRDPMRNELRLDRAKLLEEEGRLDESDAAWSEYLDRLGAMADPDVVVPALIRVARGAKRRGEGNEAIAYLERAVEVDDSRPELLRELRVAVEQSGEKRRAAALYEREADAIPNDGARTELLRASARLLREENEERELFRILNRIRGLAPSDDGVLGELVQLSQSLGEDELFFELAGALEEATGLAGLDAIVLTRLAERAEDDDLPRAKVLYQELQVRRPGDEAVMDKLRDIALATEDYDVFVELEEASIARLDDAEEQVERLKSLAGIVLKELKQAKRAANIVQSALGLAPEDRELRRRLADTYALDSNSYRNATNIYRELLEDDPFDVGLLRILARLFGQIGDTDRAFGYYAALRALMPSDDEAKRFVEACRKAMPSAPPRPLSDTDRGRGLIHPEQLGPVEELYAPLARFGELTHPGDLRMRGVDERDRLAPTDPVGQVLVKILEATGLPNAELYGWRGGGFACEVELVGKAAILVGSMLVSDASERQRAFLVVRAGELYRTGHTLCDRLSPGQLESLTAALALAVAPDANVPGVTTQSQEWAKAISAPMTPQIRQQLAPRVHQYIERFGEVDIAAWRRACLSTAARTALVVTCDIDEAISAMLRLRGFDDVTDDQKPAVLRESPEELDLWKFALSETYFKLRASLGIALRSG